MILLFEVSAELSEKFDALSINGLFGYVKESIAKSSRRVFGAGLDVDSAQISA